MGPLPLQGPGPSLGSPAASMALACTSPPVPLHLITTPIGCRLAWATAQPRGHASMSSMQLRMAPSPIGHCGTQLLQPAGPTFAQSSRWHGPRRSSPGRVLARMTMWPICCKKINSAHEGGWVGPQASHPGPSGFQHSCMCVLMCPMLFSPGHVGQGAEAQGIARPQHPIHGQGVGPRPHCALLILTVLPPWAAATLTVWSCCAMVAYPPPDAQQPPSATIPFLVVQISLEPVNMPMVSRIGPLLIVPLRIPSWLTPPPCIVSSRVAEVLACQGEGRG